MKGRTASNAPAPQSPKLEKNGAGKLEKKQNPTKSSGATSVPEKKPHGGKRDRAGRKSKAERIDALGVSDTLEQHLVEEVEVIEVNAQTGARKRSKKPTLQALLDMLRHEALKNKSVPAAKEYMDRTLGRAKQRIEHEGGIEVDDQRPLTKAEQAAALAYEAALDEEDDDLEDDDEAGD